MSKNVNNIYEISFLVDSLLEQKGVDSFVKQFKKEYLKEARLIHEGYPKKIYLAYEMRSKQLEGSTYGRHNKAFFVNIKVELAKDKINAINEYLTGENSIVRHLIEVSCEEEKSIQNRYQELNIEQKMEVLTQQQRDDLDEQEGEWLGEDEYDEDGGSSKAKDKVEDTKTI